MERNFIPILVYGEKGTQVWQLDITDLKLSELLELRKKLTGTLDSSVKGIDAVIHRNYSYDYYKDDTTSTDRKEQKRRKKEEKHKVRKRARESKRSRY